jgi:hypothetical protein
MAALDFRPPGPTLRAFMRDDSYFRGIQGPVGSAKSTTCAIEIMRRAAAQKPGKDKLRRSRWVVVRNTYAELRTTTIKTWLMWFPENDWGHFAWSAPPTHHIRKAEIDLEVIFLALDKPEDIKKLLSLEVTGAWLNEARELDKAIVDGATQRVGRYPSKSQGGPSWYGVIADTNAPSENHWWSFMSGQVPLPEWMPEDDKLTMRKPAGWTFYLQPGAYTEVMDPSGALIGYAPNPLAENVENLPEGYYEQQMQGKTRAYIRAYVCNKLATLNAGKMVYPSFRREIHVARETIVPYPGVDLIVGIDFGRTPAAVVCQHYRGRWLVLGELITENSNARKFAEELRAYLHRKFPNSQGRFYGDPAGDHRPQTEDETPFRILRAAGINAYPTHSNDPLLRIEAVTLPLERLADGVPAFLVDPSCTTLIAGFEGGYHFRRLQVSGEPRYDDSPHKNSFSHVHDALQYAFLGGGEGRRLVSGPARPVPVVAPRTYNVLARTNEIRMRPRP